MSQELDKKRLGFARSNLDNMRSEEELKNFRSVIRGATVTLRQSGILQLSVFWLSKIKYENGRPSGAQCQAVHLMLAWLAESPVTERIVDRDWTDDAARPFDIVAQLCSCDSRVLGMFEHELEAFFDMVGRLVEARYCAVKKENV